MASTGAKLQPDRRSGERWWCSQLVTISSPGAGGGQTVNMENISAGGACIAVDRPFDAGDRLHLKTAGFETAVTVVYCNVREDDFAVGLEFDSGFQWAPEDWEPDHLLRLPGPEQP